MAVLGWKKYNIRTPSAITGSETGRRGPSDKECDNIYNLVIAYH